MLLSRNAPLSWRLAALVGLVHASFSAYWALGGSLLLATVGQRAVDLQTSAPVGAGVVLLIVATLKVALSVLPLTDWLADLLQRRAWRAALWFIAAGLFVYGTVYSVTGIGVVTGVIDPAGGYDRAGMIGHAFIWDPLFAAWGVLLGLGLLALRRSRCDVSRHRNAGPALAGPALVISRLCGWVLEPPRD